MPSVSYHAVTSERLCSALKLVELIVFLKAKPKQQVTPTPKTLQQTTTYTMKTRVEAVSPSFKRNLSVCQM